MSHVEDSLKSCPKVLLACHIAPATALELGIGPAGHEDPAYLGAPDPCAGRPGPAAHPHPPPPQGSVMAEDRNTSRTCCKSAIPTLSPAHTMIPGQIEAAAAVYGRGRRSCRRASGLIHRRWQRPFDSRENRGAHGLCTLPGWIVRVRAAVVELTHKQAFRSSPGALLAAQGAVVPGWRGQSGVQ